MRICSKIHKTDSTSLNTLYKVNINYNNNTNYAFQNNLIIHYLIQYFKTKKINFIFKQLKFFNDTLSS